MLNLSKGRGPGYFVIAIVTLVSLVPAAVCTDSFVDALQKSLERNLSLAEARSTLRPAEALRLRSRFNALIKQRRTAPAGRADEAAIIARMQQIQHEIDLANQRAMASRSLRFF